MAQYDTRSLGIGHRITARAWAVSHDQGSTEVNIGLFTAVAAIAPGTDGSGHKASQPAADPDDLKDALSLARAVQFLVAPWNPALTILQIFLEKIKYGYRAFSNQKDHVSQLSNFIDQVLMANARSWQLNQPCMMADDLAAMWVTFTAGRSTSTNDGTTKERREENQERSRGEREGKRRRDWEQLRDGARERGRVPQQRR